MLLAQSVDVNFAR